MLRFACMFGACKNNENTPQMVVGYFSLMINHGRIRKKSQTKNKSKHTLHDIHGYVQKIRPPAGKFDLGVWFGGINVHTHMYLYTLF